MVLTAAAGHSFLFVLDAPPLAERARATLPHPIPLGFHGNQIPDPVHPDAKAGADSRGEGG